MGSTDRDKHRLQDWFHKQLSTVDAYMIVVIVESFVTVKNM